MIDPNDPRASGVSLEDVDLVPVKGTEVSRHALAHDHVLELTRGADGNVLRVLAPGGRTGISITVTSAGIRLDIAAADLSIHTDGALAIDADELTLRGKSGVVIESEGDAHIRAAGDIHSEARIQNIHARLGNVNVEANDDVVLLGERVRLNV